MSTIISVPFSDKYDHNEKITTATKGQIIINDGFFPDIDTLVVRNTMRIDGTVTDARLKMAIIEAMLTTNRELKPLKKRLRSDGVRAIQEQHGSDDVGGFNPLYFRYQRAVMCYALANVYERYISYDITKGTAEKTQLINQSIDELKRDAQYAIADMLDTPRVTVALL